MLSMGGVRIRHPEVSHSSLFFHVQGIFYLCRVSLFLLATFWSNRMKMVNVCSTFYQFVGHFYDSKHSMQWLRLWSCHVVNRWGSNSSTRGVVFDSQSAKLRHYSFVVPLPWHQGWVVPRATLPGKFANAELMKIPNFLHLTPIERQMPSIEKWEPCRLQYNR
jgi:hypothetical protein